MTIVNMVGGDGGTPDVEDYAQLNWCKQYETPGAIVWFDTIYTGVSTATTDSRIRSLGIRYKGSNNLTYGTTDVRQEFREQYMLEGGIGSTTYAWFNSTTANLSNEVSVLQMISISPSALNKKASLYTQLLDLVTYTTGRYEFTGYVVGAGQTTSVAPTSIPKAVQHYIDSTAPNIKPITGVLTVAESPTSFTISDVKFPDNASSLKFGYSGVSTNTYGTIGILFKTLKYAPSPTS